MHLCRLIKANDPTEKLLRLKEAEKLAKKPRVPPNVPIPGISAPCLVKDLSMLQDFYDFVFGVQEKEIKAHKAVLSCSFQEV